ncbi:ABC transporter transmembrane domain-containing protein [Streptococcus sp. 27098_8_75]|uniref:ABC transporter ATP-binding protein n=1 Tax=Streptococcus TaxID=1301 RepID=UPI00189793B1|nr:MULTISPECIES: ABC transporter transmembrane domain-containing protein [Streptococcus]MBS6245417.1 ATP-binding cassette domain-containing protein [Streptococcus sp.]MCB6583718.1 ATP-binding cassette domain-containing protein [Streptococcus gordonii]MCB7054096.1 ATP-binding cassette domain-containing protein [Streptococcus gordonii]MCB7056183.1 ATP-binding cassette domain-containing protein [Streptococcus gordonii]MCG4842400.1 ATP-binding cassette domain-containing protein [Streptococcus gord
MKLLKKLSWFFKLEKWPYITGILALSLVSLLNLLPPRVIGEVIDQIASKDLTNLELAYQLFILVLSALAMYALRFVWRKYILGTANRLGRILRYRLFEHFTHMSPSFYQTYRTGDLMAHATNDINAVVGVAGGGVMSAVDASITALVTVLTMFFVLDWRLTLIAILPLPFMAWGTSLIGRKNHESFKAAQEAFSDLNNKVQESVSGIKVTKSFGYQDAETAAFARINQDVFKKNILAAKYNALFDPMVLIFVGLSYLLTLIFGGLFISQGQLTVGELVTFITYLDMLVWPLQAMGYLFNISQRGTVSYERIESLLAQESDVIEVASPITDIKNGRLDYSIQEFAYDDRPTLRDIHFSIEQGQTLGIVGVTGSGKTTLLRLLLREQDIQEGSIYLAGHDIRDYSLSALRSLIGYVPQDQILFATSIRDNIRFGNPSLSDEDVIAVTKLCGIYEDIMQMPDGFDTLVGERGVSLSGGQKQRLAMCRALILNPDILILDDSLSAVDAKTEHLILDNLKRERSGKTTLITAHRLSAVVHADLILVLDQGQVIESGSHQELLTQDGWYATTYQNQQLAESLEEV